MLVVDDDDSVRKVMAQMLTVLGYAVVTATNGLEALDLFDAQREQIDLVITDLRMPVMDGYETVERIKKVKPAAPIICMSSHSAVPCPTGARFLPKPFTLASVEECVGRAICDSAR